MIRPIRAAAFSLAAAAMLAAPAAAQTFGGSERVPAITLNGTGQSYIDPDLARVSAGVVSQAATANEALRQNSAAMDGVFRELRNAGIQEREIQTSSLSVNPVYAPQTGNDRDGPRIIAYRASNTVNVTVRDLDRLGPAIDALVTAGANTINNVGFDREDSSAAMNEARREAIQDALATARLYAEAGGFRLGRILSVSESSYRPMPMMAEARMAAAPADFAPTPTAPGQLSIQAQVNIEIEIIQ